MDISIPGKNGETINFATRAVITGIDAEHLSPMSQLYMHTFFPMTETGNAFCTKLDKRTPDAHPLLCEDI
jgi:hypothetical protein